MSTRVATRHRALLCAGLILVPAAACRPGEVARGTPGRAPESPRGPVTPEGLPATAPTVTIGILVDSSRVDVGATSAYTVVDGEGVTLATSPATTTWRVVAGGGGLEAVSSDGDRAATGSQTLRVVPSGDGRVRIGSREYRGETLVRTVGSNVTAINVVEIEAYLLAVVTREIGRRPSGEIEAVKAQAVAARTYAIGNLGARSSQGFDLYATIFDQVYGGTADEDSVATRAVLETRGEILTYDGQPIIAYYSSTCGGRTANIEDSWPWRGPQPYLKSTSDRRAGGDGHYCDTSSRFEWTTTWTRDSLVAMLGETLELHTRGATREVRRVGSVRILDRNDSERVTVALTADGTEHVLRADSLRWVLRPRAGPALLNSAYLSDIGVTVSGNEVTHLEIGGHGWGHGIGMCQVGAMGRARDGQSYEEILKAYYRGVEVERLY